RAGRGSRRARASARRRGPRPGRARRRRRARRDVARDEGHASRGAWEDVTRPPAVTCSCDGPSLVRATTLPGRLHLHDLHGQIADGLSVDAQLEVMRSEAREAHVVELDDDVDVLSRGGVHGDLRRIRHGLLAVGAHEPHHDRVRADLQPEDRDEEHARMLRGQPAHADVPEDAEQADLAVLPDERVVAQGGEADLRGHFVTMLTSLPGTTITFAGAAPPSAARTFPLARARRSSSSLGVPAATVSLSRTLPSTWTTIVSSVADASFGSNAGHACRWTEPVPPRRCHSSSLMYGANGASSSTSVETPSSRLGPAAFISVFVSSIMAAIAVLKAYASRSSPTFWMVRWTARSTSASRGPAGCAGATPRSHTRRRKRWQPSMPAASQSAPCVHGPRNIMKRRSVSAP